MAKILNYIVAYGMLLPIAMTLLLVHFLIGFVASCFLWLAEGLTILLTNMLAVYGDKLALNVIEEVKANKK